MKKFALIITGAILILIGIAATILGYTQPRYRMVAFFFAAFTGSIMKPIPKFIQKERPTMNKILTAVNANRTDSQKKTFWNTTLIDVICKPRNEKEDNVAIAAYCLTSMPLALALPTIVRKATDKSDLDFIPSCAAIVASALAAIATGFAAASIALKIIRR